MPIVSPEGGGGGMKSTTARGYGTRHQALRRRWGALLARTPGGIPCARCGDPVVPSDRWELDHDDEDRTRYLGISHWLCNRKAGGDKSQQPKVAAVTREW